MTDNESPAADAGSKRSGMRTGLMVVLLAAGIWAAETPPGTRDTLRQTLEEKTQDGAWDPDAACQALAARWDTVEAGMDAPMERLMLPLEYYPDGRLKARLFAEQAQLFDNGNTIFAKKVKVELLTQEGEPDGELVADGCLFDRKGKYGYCKGVVRVVKDGDQIKGVGMFFSSLREFIKILSNCEIRTNRFKGVFDRL